MSSPRSTSSTPISRPGSPKISPRHSLGDRRSAARPFQRSTDIRPAPPLNDVDEFLGIREKRSVHKKWSTVEVAGQRFLVSPALRKFKVHVLYDPSDLARGFIALTNARRMQGWESPEHPDRITQKYGRHDRHFSERETVWANCSESRTIDFGRGTGFDSDVDASLVAWMLSLSAVERLAFLQGHVDSIIALRNARISTKVS